MELVYLWVEDYKNIKNQGFNFSPRFECDYKDGVLDIKDKKKNKCENNEYLENFFGENINVTAIVGENGSGKSGILECIEKIILSDDTQTLDDFNYILVYYEEVPLYISNLKITTEIDKETVTPDICSLVYKYSVLDEDIHQAKYYSSANLHYFTLQKQGIIDILSAKQTDMQSFHISSFMYEPIKVEISLKSYEKLIQEHRPFFNFKKQDEIEKILTTITDSYHQYLSILYIRQKGLEVDSEILKNKASLIKNTNTSLSKNSFNTFFNTVITTEEYKLTKMSQEQKDIYFCKDYWHYFEFDFMDEKGRRYNHLSHGEKVIFSQLLSIFFYITNNEKLLFLFDEPEIALHPNWQKKYLSEVLSLLQNIPKIYHFIFATHSPFLLSDLSEENVIFLEKYQEQDTEVKNGTQVIGNCKNSTKDIKINPFGANIHTLLSHGFFMKDGLMGEFAKRKINKMISFLNGKNKFIDFPTSQIKPIIKNIGEDFLKEKLTLMYDKKFPKSKNEQIKELEKKIIELKQDD